MLTVFFFLLKATVRFTLIVTVTSVLVLVVFMIVFFFIVVVVFINMIFISNRIMFIAMTALFFAAIY